MRVVAEHLPGIRVVRQDPWECICSFIFSSNNNIKRIHKGLQGLRQKYGKYLCSVIPSTKIDNSWEVSHSPGLKGSKEEAIGGYFDLYEFPTIDALRQVSEQEFRDMGMGYRAKFLQETIHTICEKGGHAWLDSLRHMGTQQVQDELIKLSGIGLKVADCIALFSLDQSSAIPVGKRSEVK
jgi:N-glycosylase/DNA lyase